MLRNAKLVTFDAYDTIYSTVKPVMQLYSTIAKRHQINVQPQHLEHRFPSVYKQLNREFPLYGKGKIEPNEWWCRMIQGVFEPAHVPTHVCNEILHEFATCAYKVYPDVRRFMQRSNAIICVVSNTDPTMLQLLRNLSIEFDHVYLSYDMELKKPDPRVWEHVLQDVNKRHNTGIQPHECFHIGDEIENDMEGPVNAGWNGVLLDRLNRFGLQSGESVTTLDKIGKSFCFGV